MSVNIDVRTPLVGNPAPSWKTMAYQQGEFKELSSDNYKGKWYMLFFYPLDFTFVCPTEITGFNDALGEFQANNCEVIGCSIDSQFVHKAWHESGTLGDLKIPLLSDLNKNICADFGVLNGAGFALRGLFIVDPEGVMQYAVGHNTDVGRSVDETMRVLEALQSGGLCPMNWKKGDKTL